MYTRKISKKIKVKVDESPDDVVFVKEYPRAETTRFPNRSRIDKTVKPVFTYKSSSCLSFIPFNDLPVVGGNAKMKERAANFDSKTHQYQKHTRKRQSQVNLTVDTPSPQKIDKFDRTSTKQIVESKATTSKESNMINVISNIVSPCNKKKSSPGTPIDMDATPVRQSPTKRKSPKLKKMKTRWEPIDTPIRENSEPSCSTSLDTNEEFDPDGVLAKKIKDKLNLRSTQKDAPKSSPVKCSPNNIPDVFSCEVSHLKKEPVQKLEFINSVVEVFDKNYTNEKVKFNTVSEVPYSNILQQANIDGIITLSDNEYSEDDDGVEIIDDSAEMVNDSVIILNDEDDDEEQNTMVNSQDKCKFHIISNFCIFIMEKSYKAYFCGKLKVSALYGHVEVLGHRLTEEPCEVYSIVTSSLLCFESFVGNAPFHELSASLQNLGLLPPKIAEIMKDVTKGCGVLLLRPHRNTMTEFISKHLTSFDIFSNVRNANHDYEVFKVLQCNFFNGVDNGIFMRNSIWDEVLHDNLLSAESGSTRSVTLVCGGKNCGKSTTVRYMVNKLLVQGPVLVLDLDPGQPEFTVCGLISATVVTKPLLGPNFTHLQDPNRSYSIGLINVVENTERYLNAVAGLYEYLQGCKEYNEMPWIINTMGFTSVLGLKFLTAILSICRPTTVVQMEHPLVKNNFTMEITNENINAYMLNTDYTSWRAGKLNAPHNYKYFICPAYLNYEGNMVKPFIRRNLHAKIERLLNVLAYFSKMATLKCSSLLNLEPNMVSLKDIKLAMNYIMIDHKYLINILNGRLIALCCDEEYSRKANTSNVFIFGKSPMECLGYALIRGVDPVNDILYILTPLDVTKLNRVNMLVYAETLPDCSGIFSAPNLPYGTMIPYTAPVLATIKNRHLHQIPRRKYNPLRLFYVGNNPV